MSVALGKLVLIVAGTLPAMSRDSTAAPPAFERMQKEIQLALGYSEPPPLLVKVAADSNDAAGRYMWLARHIPPELETMSSWVNADTYEVFKDDSHTITIEDAERVFAAHQEWFNAFRETTSLPTAQFCFSSSPRTIGYASGDPRDRILGRLRLMHRIVQFEVRRRWQANLDSEACALFEAHLRFVKHLGDQQGGVLVEIVAEAMLGSALSQLDRWLTKGFRVPPERAVAIAAILDSFDPNDPTGRRACDSTYRRGVLAFARSELAEGGEAEALRHDLAVTRGAEHFASVFSEHLQQMLEGQIEAEDILRFDWQDRLRVLVGFILDLAAMHPVNMRRSLDQCEALSREIDSRWETPDFSDWFKAHVEPLPDDRTGLRLWTMVDLAGAVHRSCMSTRGHLQRAKDLMQPLAASPHSP